MKRRALIAGIVVAALLTPLSLLPALVACNAVNPMQGMFIIAIEVVNESGRAVEVVPIGTFLDGSKAVVPMFWSGFPAIARMTNVPYGLAPGATKTIRFDCDDINFSELAVRDGSSGEWRQLVTDPNPPKNDYYDPRERHFVIPEFGQLEPVAPEVAAGVARPSQRLWLYALAISFAFPPFVLVHLVRALRRDNARLRRAAVPLALGDNEGDAGGPQP